MPNWLMKLTQLAIFVAVAGAAAQFEWTENGALRAAWGFVAAFAFTLAYAKIADWLNSRPEALPAPPEADECSPESVSQQLHSMLNYPEASRNVLPPSPSQERDP